MGTQNLLNTFFHVLAHENLTIKFYDKDVRFRKCFNGFLIDLKMFKNVQIFFVSIKIEPFSHLKEEVKMFFRCSFDQNRNSAIENSVFGFVVGASLRIHMSLRIRMSK